MFRVARRTWSIANVTRWRAKRALDDQSPHWSGFSFHHAMNTHTQVKPDKSDTWQMSISHSFLVNPLIKAQDCMAKLFCLYRTASVGVQYSAAGVIHYRQRCNSRDVCCTWELGLRKAFQCLKVNHFQTFRRSELYLTEMCWFLDQVGIKPNLYAL